MRFIGSNSGDSLSDTGGYGSTNLDDDDLVGVKSPSGTMRTTQQQVPPIITACIDHLTMYGLNVVGIFRVSTSKRRIREVNEMHNGCQHKLVEIKLIFFFFLLCFVVILVA